MIFKFKELVFGNQIPKKIANQPLPVNYNTLVGSRHAGILGLCSLVLAFPYDVPEFIPKILVLLAKCAGNPSPISVF